MLAGLTTNTSLDQRDLLRIRLGSVGASATQSGPILRLRLYSTFKWMGLGTRGVQVARTCLNPIRIQTLQNEDG